MSNNMGLATYVDVHRNVVLEIRQGDKILAWVSFSGPQAKGVASGIDKLADMIMQGEAKVLDS